MDDVYFVYNIIFFVIVDLGVLLVFVFVYDLVLFYDSIIGLLYFLGFVDIINEVNFYFKKVWINRILVFLGVMLVYRLVFK